MSQAPRYEINLTHGDLHISLASDDVYFISKQMNQWLKIFLSDKYVPVTVPERPTVQPKAAPPAPKPKPVLPSAQPAGGAVQTPYQEPVYEEAPPVKKAPPPPPVERHVPRPHPAAQAPAEYDDDYAPPAPKPRAKTVSLPGEVEIPEYRPAPEYSRAAEPSGDANILDELENDLGPAETIAAAADAPSGTNMLDEGVKDDFEMVMDSLMKDLGDEDDDAPPPFANAPRPMGKPLPVQRPPISPMPKKAVKGGMDSAYEQVKLPVGLLDEEEATEPHSAIQTPIDSLSDLCDRARAATSEDYLILTAYFLTYFEGVEKFSLKKVNSMLVKSGLTPVNHSVLESGLSNGHVAMVQDMTGTADVSEYTMTLQGKDYASSLL